MLTLHSSLRAAACCALTTIACMAAAADKQTVPDPADPHAPVPATRYQSALAQPPAAPAEGTPAQNWKALNATVGALDSMALTMREEAAPAEPHAAHQHEEKP